MPRKDRTSNSRMWLQRSVARQHRLSSLFACPSAPKLRMAATAMSQKSFVGAQLQHLPARAQTQDRAVRAAVVRWRGWAVVTLRSDSDPRDRMSRVSPAGPQRAAVAPVLAWLGYA